MNRLCHTVLVLTVLTGCATRTVETTDAGSPHDAGPTSRVDGSDAGKTSPPPDAPPDAPAYAACPGVYAGPVPEADAKEPRREGLAVWRDRVLRSRETFRRYAAAWGGTYRYTRYIDSVFGFSCTADVKVTGGVVTSVTDSTLNDRGEPWSRGSPSSNPPKSSCVPEVTMDALYDQCLTEVLCQDPRENHLYLQIDARGLLVQCGYFPMNCADDCYEGFGPLLLTADGNDWTKPLPGCCEPAPAPDCCMDYGGPSRGDRCGLTCDGMPPPDNPGWRITFGTEGCAQWVEPREGSFVGCCGCAPPRDGG